MGRAFYRASLLAAIAGCQAVSPTPSKVAAPLPSVVSRAPAPPSLPTAPIEQRSSAKTVVDAEPPAPADPLTLAADCLEQGDLDAAARHLTRHVALYPDQVIFRAQLADLLTRLDNLPEAQAHFEAAAAQAQDGPPVVQKELVHYHTRLMEIARLRGNEYAEHLHRGIGLYLVAARLADRDAVPGDVERLLCKAAMALKDAQAQRPDDARTAWYLYRVWSHLDQPQPAAKALKQAAATAPFSTLTPVEARELALAGRPEIVIK